VHLLPLMRCFSLTLLLAAAPAPQGKPSPHQAAQGALAVCDILADPLKYNHQLVKIRGVSVGTDEGWWIEPDKPCSSPLTTAGYTWPSIIWVESVDESRPGRGVQFLTDHNALSKINEAVTRMHIDPKLDRIWLNFIGVFETRVFSSKDIGSGRAFGFGHLNSAQTQLPLKTVTDLHIEHVAAQK
jgi:hypothetical protein